MNSSPQRQEGADGGDEQYPVESRFVVHHTPPREQDPHFDRSAQHKTVRHTPPDEHDDAFRFDTAGWLPMSMVTTQFLRSDPAMYTSPGRTYA